MLQETITLIPVIAGLVAAAGGVWAACAAHRSAVAAQEAARHAENVDRRGLLRDLTTTAHRAHRRIEDRAPNARYFLRAIGKFKREAAHPTGRSEAEGGMPVAGGSSKTEERAQLRNASEEDLTQSLSQFDGYLVQVLRIKDSLERELAVTAGDNRIHRERRIKALHHHR